MLNYSYVTTRKQVCAVWFTSLLLLSVNSSGSKDGSSTDCEIKHLFLITAVDLYISLKNYTILTLYVQKHKNVRKVTKELIKE